MKNSLSQKSSESLSDTLANKLARLEELEGIVKNYSDKEFTPKILDETIRAKEIQLNRVLASIKRAEDNVARLQKEVQAMGLEKARLMADLTRIRKKVEDGAKESDTHLAAVKSEVREIQAEIKERNDYKKEQEELISQAIEHGNEELRVIKYELEEAQNIKQGIENETFVAKEALDSITDQIAYEASALEQSKAAHELDKSEFEESIAGMEKLVHEAKIKRDMVFQQTDKKLAQLKEKEESLIARENAMRVKTEDINLRERRLNSAEQLYS